jgi:hypothetical protein
MLTVQSPRHSTLHAPGQVTELDGPTVTVQLVDAAHATVLFAPTAAMHDPDERQSSRPCPRMERRSMPPVNDAELPPPSTPVHDEASHSSVELMPASNRHDAEERHSSRALLPAVA